MDYKRIAFFSMFFCTNYLIANSLDTIFFNEKSYSKMISYRTKDYSKDYFISGFLKIKNPKFKVVLHFEYSFLKIPKHVSIIPFNEDSVIIGRNITCGDLKDVQVFEVDSQKYQIIEYSSDYSFVVIKKVVNLPPQIIMTDGYLPKLTVKMLDNESVNLEDYLNKGKYIYLDFWGLWCGQCIKDFDQLKEINAKYSKSLSIISFNYRDGISEIKKFILEKGINWDIAITNELINRYFYVGWFPFGVLVDSDGKIIQIACSVEELKSFLISNTN